jgi:hypothetical protein
VEPHTELHLTTALENQQFAAALLADAEATRAALRWSVTAAFYAAVHYVNAYLWEVARFAPHDHRARYAAMTRWPAITPARTPYERLADAAFRARYVPGHRIPARATNRLVELDLAVIDRIIREQLN